MAEEEYLDGLSLIPNTLFERTKGALQPKVAVSSKPAAAAKPASKVSS